MDTHLPPAFFPKCRDEAVCVGIAAEQSYLKKEKTGGPNPGAAAIPRQDVASDDRLNLKEQKRAQKYRGDEEGHG